MIADDINKPKASETRGVTAEELSKLTAMVKEWTESLMPGSYDVAYEVSATDDSIRLVIWPPRRPHDDDPANDLSEDALVAALAEISGLVEDRRSVMDMDDGRRQRGEALT